LTFVTGKGTIRTLSWAEKSVQMRLPAGVSATVRVDSVNDPKRTH
jgi:hypothetical protein